MYSRKAGRPSAEEKSTKMCVKCGEKKELKEFAGYCPPRLVRWCVECRDKDTHLRLINKRHRHDMQREKRRIACQKWRMKKKDPNFHFTDESVREGDFFKSKTCKNCKCTRPLTKFGRKRGKVYKYCVDCRQTLRLRAMPRQKTQPMKEVDDDAILNMFK